MRAWSVGLESLTYMRSLLIYLENARLGRARSPLIAPAALLDRPGRGNRAKASAEEQYEQENDEGRDGRHLRAVGPGRAGGFVRRGSGAVGGLRGPETLGLGRGELRRPAG